MTDPRLAGQPEGALHEDLLVQLWAATSHYSATRRWGMPAARIPGARAPGTAARERLGERASSEHRPSRYRWGSGPADIVADPWRLSKGKSLRRESQGEPCLPRELAAGNQPLIKRT